LFFYSFFVSFVLFHFFVSMPYSFLFPPFILSLFLFLCFFFD
jgi:hypothetical protein